jgi:putative tryptophan/tyrosine transport system substrate-binding protein
MPRIRLTKFRRAARYVERVLRGEKPADLPVQAPVKYETLLHRRGVRNR